jgi:hypothetical protein
MADFNLTALIVAAQVTLDFKSSAFRTGRYPAAKRLI